MIGVDHGDVATGAELRIDLEELLVAQVQQVDLGIVEGWVHVLIQLTVPEHKTYFNIRPPYTCLPTVADNVRKVGYQKLVFRIHIRN
jgi:hypothetical protein